MKERYESFTQSEECSLLHGETNKEKNGISIGNSMTCSGIWQ